MIDEKIARRFRLAGSALAAGRPTIDLPPAPLGGTDRVWNIKRTYRRATPFAWAISGIGT
jgi:hypothetical protein